MREKYKVQLFFPLAIVIIVITFLAVAANFYFQKKTLIEQKLLNTKVYDQRFDSTIESQARIIQSYLDFLTEDTNLQNKFQQENREDLYAYVQKIYKNLNLRNDITHLYFIRLDGSVSLRVHQKNRHSDIIKRHTFLEAQKTLKTSYGLEYGVNKNFTLRVVRPWIVNEELIGYIELGKEVDKIMAILAKQLGLDIYLLIHQELYKSAEAAVKKKLQTFPQFGNHYLAYATTDMAPVELERIVLDLNKTFIVNQDERKFLNCMDNLYDVAGTFLGHKVFLVEITKEYHSLVRNTLFYFTIMMLGALGMLALGFALERYKQKKIDHTLDVLEESQNLLEEEKKNAEESNKAKSDFLANMSHEIRTPMNAILGFIQLLKQSETDEIKLQKLRLVHSSGVGLLAVINDILDFSKIESGKLLIDKQHFEIREPFYEVSSLLFEKAHENGIKTECVFDEKLPKIGYGDVLRIRQVLTNLINNAIKFTPKGGFISVKVAYNPMEKSVVCKVKDSGIGIAKEKREHIFEAFVQADVSTTRKYGGTGLGLTISSQLVNLMGGSISVKSSVGKGSSFYVSLPLLERAEESANIELHKADENVLENEVYFDGNVLLVEDNKANQMLMGIFLEDLGLTFTVAHDGLQAIEKFKSEGPFDIILMDENMPNMNGVEATKRIREYEQERGLDHTPVVAVTANALSGDREHFLEKAQMDEYLPKPIEVTELRRILGLFLKYRDFK